MDVDTPSLSPKKKEKTAVTFACKTFDKPSDTAKEGETPLEAATDNSEEEFDCPSRINRRRRAIRARLKTGPHSMTQAEKEVYDEILASHKHSEQTAEEAAAAAETTEAAAAGAAAEVAATTTATTAAEGDRSSNGLTHHQNS